MAATTYGPHPLCPDHALAYRVISDFLQKHRQDVVEIEVLPPALAPPSGSPVLEDGICLGVPKRFLAAAFIAARSVFFDKRVCSDPISVQAALDATSVILLFDPEHLTAANFRKAQLNVLRSLHNDSLAPAHSVQLELNFLDSILTSPLHRQSKSPTLWGYRAWIVQSFDPQLWLSRAPGQDATSLLSWEQFARELGVVLKAAERHPKNYYAWQYARRLFDRVPELQSIYQRQLSLLRPPPLISSSLTAPGHDFLQQSVPVVYEWCLRNPSDTSAWSFLYFLLLRTPKPARLAQQIIDRTFGLAQGFHWKHESLWTFLRTVIADPTLTSTEARSQYIQAIQDTYKKKDFLSPEAEATVIGLAHPAEKAVIWILHNASA
ncbi:protein prenyltransferase [Diplodia corticola]|uniref:Protein prenyltransferase n=1 Tax=Diplodia corticola TaxID=236234 RepID=A0A1J9S7Z6_9PEZI|nr:protein prenyltransferase [Diplodia corticola]OJD36036.1 protein prenyltransferase [Diplodia corticola]